LIGRRIATSTPLPERSASISELESVNDTLLNLASDGLSGPE
jgi:hypothetical protein